MNAHSLTAVILGDTAPAEFQGVLELIRRRLPAESLRTAPDVAAFRQSADISSLPDCVIALLAWPDQFSKRDVDELISLCPLSRILCCFGPWCDSDGRTRSIWPLGVRVPAASFAARFEHELALFANCRGVGSPLPLTAARAEIFEFDFDRPVARLISAQGVSIILPDRRFGEMLDRALRRAGFHSSAPDDTDPSRSIVFDADPWNDDRAQALARLRARHPRGRLIACSGFPRPHVDAELRDAGADDFWFKLAPLAELIELINHPSEGRHSESGGRGRCTPLPGPGPGQCTEWASRIE